MIYSKIFRAARANLLRVGKNFWRKTHEKLMIYLKNFPRCARQFVKNFIVVFHDFLKENLFLWNWRKMIFPRCARQFVENFFLFKMLTKQWYIQKISALRALISYEFLKTNSAQKLYSFKISMSINFSEIQWVRENLSSTLGQF